MKNNLAWHFVRDTLRDGSPIPADGEWLEFKGACKMCKSGLHASRTPFQALEYAPGATLCLVQIEGLADEQSDKLVCTRRKIIARMDATDLCRYFARMEALRVIHLWDAPDIVCDYLMTGDERMRAAAWDAAWAAAWDAARAAAWDAARDAARAAARAAAWDAARDAAWAAAWDPARDAAWDAAWDESAKDFNALVYDCFSDYLL